jgi:hypothetical protein
LTKKNHVIILSLGEMEMSRVLILTDFLYNYEGREMTSICFFLSFRYYHWVKKKEKYVVFCRYLRTIWVFFSLALLQIGCIVSSVFFLLIVVALGVIARKKQHRAVGGTRC